VEFSKINVQEIDRHPVAGETYDRVPPAADLYLLLSKM
jgi:hypothetical protein